MRRQNSTRGTLEVLASLKADQLALWELAEVVGRWVWIETATPPDKASRDWLLDLGFHWNPKRRAWQHPCGAFAAHSNGNPRWKYACAPATSFDSLDPVNP